MDYTTLIGAKTAAGSLANYVNYSPVANDAAELIQNAQDEIFARLRVREMRKTLTLPIVALGYTAPIPSDFLDAFVIVTPWGFNVTRLSDDRILERRLYDATGAMICGYPRSYGVWDNAIQLDMAVQNATTLNGIYYGSDYISATSTTSFLTTRYSHLFRAVLLKHTYGFMKDWDAATKADAMAQASFAAVEQGDDLSYRGLDDDGGRYA